MAECLGLPTCGRPAGYTGGCRGDACRQAKTDYTAEWRRNTEKGQASVRENSRRQAEEAGRKYRPNGPQRGSIRTAGTWLKGYLLERGGTATVAEVKAAGVKDGIEYEHLRQAAKKLVRRFEISAPGRGRHFAWTLKSVPCPEARLLAGSYMCSCHGLHKEEANA